MRGLNDMNAMCPMQSKPDSFSNLAYFAHDPLGSYLNECQKN